LNGNTEALSPQLHPLASPSSNQSIVSGEIRFNFARISSLASNFPALVQTIHLLP
jgi:hypothetical protein